MRRLTFNVMYLVPTAAFAGDGGNIAPGDGLRDGIFTMLRYLAHTVGLI